MYHYMITLLFVRIFFLTVLMGSKGSLLAGKMNGNIQKYPEINPRGKLAHQRLSELAVTSDDIR